LKGGNMKRTLKQINKEIDKLKEKLKNLKGRATEVYTRIVGYYRQVGNWNKGKRAEFGDRTYLKDKRADKNDRL
jgi:uncharacterized coiled-coil DUF342 family protein